MSSMPQIPGYDLIAELGTGSFATVWSAYDLRLDREVAVKVLSEDWCRDVDVRRSFMNEARVLVTSESHRLARGFVVDETSDGRPYLVMALADRGTLGVRMARREAANELFTPLETFSILGDLARAIGDVHALGHLHRDVKPNNVLIMEIPRGSSRVPLPGLGFDERIVLSDFGLVSRLDIHGSASVGGSPGYVAPEQAGGHIECDERSDLYPLGVIALEMLTGRAADRPTSLAEAVVVRHDPYRRLRAADVAVPDDALDLLDRLLCVDPADRPQSASDVAVVCDQVVRQLADLAADPDVSSIGGSSDRRGVWGQDLHLGDAPPTSEPEAADETVVRPRDVRAPTEQSMTDDPEATPRRSPWTAHGVDSAIGLAAAALIVVAVVLWIT